MKTLRNSLAAIFAILAVSLTIAAQAGVFESKAKIYPNGTCRVNDAIAGLYHPTLNSCTDVPVALTCSVTPIGKFIANPTLNTTQFECPGPEDAVFCCAVLSEETCPANPSKKKIVDILCQEEQ